MLLLRNEIFDGPACQILSKSLAHLHHPRIDHHQTRIETFRGAYFALNSATASRLIFMSSTHRIGLIGDFVGLKYQRKNLKLAWPALAKNSPNCVRPWPMVLLAQDFFLSWMFYTPFTSFYFRGLIHIAWDVEKMSGCDKNHLWRKLLWRKWILVKLTVTNLPAFKKSCDKPLVTKNPVTNRPDTHGWRKTPKRGVVEHEGSTSIDVHSTIYAVTPFKALMTVL